jgi:hypothetical protein
MNMIIKIVYKTFLIIKLNLKDKKTRKIKGIVILFLVFLIIIIFFTIKL